MKVSFASRSSTLMQSPEAASTLRRNSRSACWAAAASRSRVRLRTRLTKPRCASAASRRGSISLWPQKGAPRFVRCQRSSSARPVSSAHFISFEARCRARSSGVKRQSAEAPIMSCADQPNICSAPGLQVLTRPSRSVSNVMAAGSGWPKSSMCIDKYRPPRPRRLSDRAPCAGGAKSTRIDANPCGPCANPDHCFPCECSMSKTTPTSAN